MISDRVEWLASVKEQLGEVDVAVEIGVWRGYYSTSIIKVLNPKTFYGVDPYTLYKGYTDKPGGMSNPEFNSQTNLNKLFWKVKEKFKIYDNAILAREYGNEYANDFEDNSVDFVYLDSNHKYECVKEEIEAWWAKIKIGGILSGHDYKQDSYFGVIPAVDEFVKREKVELNTTDEEFATWWVIK